MVHKVLTNTESLYNAIKSGAGYDAVKALIADPKELGHFGTCMFSDGIASVPYPLTWAIDQNNIEAARAILDVLKDEKTAHDVAEYISMHMAPTCPSGNPFYVDLAEGKLPHAYVKSPEMIELLHEYGYKLHGENYSLYQDFITRIEAYLSEPDKVKAVFPLLRKTVELDTEPNQTWYEHRPTGTDRKLATYAYNSFCAHLRSIQTSSSNKVLETKITSAVNTMIELARLGFDCRKFDEYSRFTWPDPDIRLEFVKSVRYASEHYMDITDADERRDCVRSACATERFPGLLQQCIKADAQSGNNKQTSELLSYVQPFWKKEYSESIRHVKSTLARTTRTADSNLDRYIRTESPSNTGPGVA